jgi:arsenate reductase
MAVACPCATSPAGWAFALPESPLPATLPLPTLSTPMKKTLYGIPNCDTVKKARTWLPKTATTSPSTTSRSRAWTAKRRRAGSTARLGSPGQPQGHDLAQSADERKAAVVDKASALELMLEHTSVIKRPVLEGAARWRWASARQLRAPDGGRMIKTSRTQELAAELIALDSITPQDKGCQQRLASCCRRSASCARRSNRTASPTCGRARAPSRPCSCLPATPTWCRPAP